MSRAAIETTGTSWPTSFGFCVIAEYVARMAPKMWATSPAARVCRLDRAGIEDALSGFTLHPLDEGWSPFLSGQLGA